MKQQKKKSRRTGRAAHLRGPTPKPADELTVAKRYTSIPEFAVQEIRKAAKVYGSQGRALQVATEILIRMRKRPLVPREANSVVTKMTYKLVPRTVELIDELAGSVYKDRCEVFAACIEALKITDI
jgi:hypothetical protein